MALTELSFTFKADNPKPLPVEWSHTGVVGSGDMEVMFERKDLDGAVEIRVITPVTGFDQVWEKVLDRFVRDSGLADVSVEINDNNATPVVVGMRMRQAVEEARKEA
ncbi:MAG TPA: malonate decarboxylase acyl carrier protein [Rubneribacter badeniensis]|uniref:Malonate decarboxylase acyl carrier protein n=1 Tax=Rubneribacter badeniensis TaxID=2070688 RepID=A0A9D2VIQ8_9ACTN|nr:malonate decarboxylase acyl carrier protein [Rubneribacter badeniensis]